MRIWKRHAPKHRLERHRHVWNYGPQTTGGWGVVRCSVCGYTDIF